jgi:hypothetical protein
MVECSIFETNKNQLEMVPTSALLSDDLLSMFHRCSFTHCYQIPFLESSDDHVASAVFVRCDKNASVQLFSSLHVNKTYRFDLINQAE